MFAENGSAEAVQEPFEIDENDLKDEELMRLVAEVEEKNELEEMPAVSEEIESRPEPEEEIEEEEENSDLDDIFEDEDDEDEIYVQTDTLISRAYQHFEEQDWSGGLAVLEDGLGQMPEDSDLRFQYALALAKH